MHEDGNVRGIVVFMKRRRCSRGVTLIEVLIVVAIMSLISAGVVVGVIPMYLKARIELATQDARSLRGGAQRWNMFGSSDCPTVEQLRKEGVIDKASNANDPWGRPFKIVCDEGDVVVISAGPDGKEGSDDDIVVPTP